MRSKTRFRFEEFFCGGGMVRAAMGEEWQCVLANDISGAKGLVYQDNWGTGGELFVGDISNTSPDLLEDNVDMSWASFPCQDLSVAGKGRGLSGERSGTFHAFWNKMNARSQNFLRPKVIVIENVPGTLTANGGQDFEVILQTFVDNGYVPGGLILDAKPYVPQSRKRLFVVGVRNDLDIDPVLTLPTPSDDYHPYRMRKAVQNMSHSINESMVWWNLPDPISCRPSLQDILEDDKDVNWDAESKTNKFLERMTEANCKKVAIASRTGVRTVGTLFHRTRMHDGSRKVRTEVRFDGVAGCLRTPNGGSSRQALIIVDGNDIKTRLLSGRETARLMGLPDSYSLPENQNAAFHLTGDGVVVPVVEFLRRNLIEPLVGCWPCSTRQSLSVKIYN